MTSPHGYPRRMTGHQRGRFCGRAEQAATDRSSVCPALPTSSARTPFHRDRGDFRTDAGLRTAAESVASRARTERRMAIGAVGVARRHHFTVT